MRKLVYILAAIIFAMAGLGPAFAAEVRLPGLDPVDDSFLSPWIQQTQWFKTDFLGTGKTSQNWVQNPRRGSFSAKLLPLSAYTGNTPAFQAESELEQESPYGGRLALEWQADRWGLAFGGGYSRTAANTTDSTGASSSGIRAMSSGANSGGGSDSQNSSLDRWSAFVAVPYKISDRFGLRPEFSYYYGEPAESAAEPENEWVMGLQFNFGF